MAEPTASGPTVDTWIGSDPEPPPPAEPTPPPAEPTAPPAEPPPPAEPAAAAPHAPPVDPNAQPGRDRVPWGKYRELEREHQTTAQRLAAIEQENERLKRALTGAPDPTPKAPEWDSDPLTWSKEQIDRLAQSNQALATQIQEMQLVNTVSMQEQQYASQHQEYLEARDTAINTRRTYWNLIYPNNPQVAEQMVDAERRLIMQAALSSGRSVPELVMELAPHFGWKGTAAAAPPAPTGAGPSAPDPARVAQMRAAAQVAATSVSSVPGAAAGKSTITRDQLLHMSQAELDAMDEQDPGWLERLDA